MGAPSSALFSEIYLQHIEHNQILNLLIKHKVISYHRYVDGILIVYNTQHKNIDNTLNDFNTIYRRIQFSMEAESNNRTKFIAISIVRTRSNLKFGIFRKPTATDIMIHSMSCHLVENKFVGINYLVNRITTYPITKKKIDIEEQNINHLLKINGYHYLNATKLIRHKQLHTNDHNNKDTNTNNNHKKWAVYTYTGKDTRFISERFKEFNINISFRTNNAIENLLTKKRLLSNQYDESGVHELK
jgi:hypothetical protein